MEKDKLEIVLADMFDELKILNNNMLEQKQQVAQLQEKIYDLKEKANRLNEAASPATDIKPMIAIINATLNDLKQVVQQQIKPIIREWRFLLFPANYSKEYYDVIFRLIMWMTLACIGTFLFSLSKQALEISKEIKLRQLENSQYKNAWNYLYNEENKQGKKKMEQAWEQALNKGRER